MQQQLANLLALLPEDKHSEFLSRLPTETAAAIANEADDVDEATLQAIAEAVWACLEE